jgi:AcrR family transcriptional regulator
LLIEAAVAAQMHGNGDRERQDIARRAQVSAGLEYRRFGSKSGLIPAVVDHFYDQLGQAIDLGDFHEQDWGIREKKRVSRLVNFLCGTAPATAAPTRAGSISQTWCWVRCRWCTPRATAD